MSASGGAAPRSGFIYQDFVAAYYFLTFEEVDEIFIERYHSDFAYFKLSADPPQKHFYEIKSSDSGPLYWSSFKSNIAPEFATIAIEQSEEKVRLFFHLVSNYKPNDQLSDFFDQIEQLRKGSLAWPGFKTRVQRSHLNPLRQAIERELDCEINDEVFGEVLTGLVYKFHSRDYLDEKIEDYLKKCSRGRYTDARDTILNNIHQTSDGAIRKSELEDQIGFDLEHTDDSTSGSTYSPKELRAQVEEIQDQHRDPDVNVTAPLEEKESVTEYIEYLRESGDLNQSVMEGLEANLDEEFATLEDAKRTERSARQNIATDISSLLESDDSTSSEWGETNE